MPEQVNSSYRFVPVGLLLRESWNRYKKQLDSLIWIAVVPSLVLAFSAYLNLFNGTLVRILGDLVNLAGVVLSILSALALIYAAQNDRQFSEGYSYAWSHFWKYIWVYLLSIAVISGGLFLAVIPGLLLMVWLSLTGYVFVVEGDRGFGALLKSKEYIRGHFWPFVLRLLIAFLIGLVVSAIADAVGSVGGQPGLIALNLLSEILLAPFMVIYMLELYKSFRQLRPEMIGARIRNNSLTFELVAIWGVVAPVALSLVLILTNIGASLARLIMK